MSEDKKPPRPRARPLDPTEHAEWESVAQSIRPLKKKDVAPGSAPKPDGPIMRSRGMLGPGSGPLGVHHPARQADPPAPPVHHGPAKIPPVEPRLLKDIRRGQVHIDATLDLHGETQARAYPMLERFLSVARTRGNRIILVITGSGVKRQVLSRPFDDAPPQPARPAPDDIGSGFMDRREPGVLKRALPQWLCAPPIRDWVVGYSGAAPHHGGPGAFYVVLRRAHG